VVRVEEGSRTGGNGGVAVSGGGSKLMMGRGGAEGGRVGKS